MSEQPSFDPLAFLDLDGPPAPDWPSAIDNPYWAIVSQLPGDTMSRRRWQPETLPLREALRDPDRTLELFGTRPNRRTLVTTYAWAIPSPPAIDWLVTQLAGTAVVEIGAGTGYWAWMLTQSGVDVAAYDLNPPAREPNWFHGPANGWELDLPAVEYHPVRRGGPSAILRHQDRALLLCWPPFHEDLAANALRVYTGDTLIYCGERDDGNCADETFFRMLEEQWEEVASCEQHVSWAAMHDGLWLFRRRPARRSAVANVR